MVITIGRVRKSVLIWATALLLLQCGNAVADDLFPSYPVLSENVRFWERVYSEISVSQGVLHDRHDLGIVYKVIGLRYPGTRDAWLANRKRVETVRAKYRRILLKLADGRKPSSFEERKVLRLFGDDPSPERLLKAAGNIRLQMGQRGRFKKGLVRAGNYLAEIKNIFRLNDLPGDLAYLAHVESSYNHSAYSKSGAVGLWQFTRKTGKRFLTINHAVDERLDPIKSTRAAAEFLKENYNELGSWPLAITAYNHGQGGVRRAVRAKGDFQNIIKEYRGRLFGFASRNFYAEFLAARKVAANYRDYFGELVLDRPEAVRKIGLEGFTDIRRLAGYLNMDVDTISQYNPDLTSPVIAGKKFIPQGYELRLPARLIQQARLAAAIPDSLYSGGLKNELFHQVRTGENLVAIANDHNVGLEELLWANKIDSSSMIYAGQNLRIPKPGSSPVHLTRAYKLLAKNLRRAEADT